MYCVAPQRQGRMQDFAPSTTGYAQSARRIGLTLNVLLSFAQFEREVTSERIRDKIGACKRKGLWVGGMAPLGYDTKDRKITVNDAEADRVRTIFRSYLKLGNLNLLIADLRTRGIVTKVRTLKTGQTAGGIPFTRGPLAYLLRNSPSQPVLRRKGGLQGRDPGRRAARHR
jgi:DNA invertase Pin-like site-specific DNA recombinase